MDKLKVNCMNYNRDIPVKNNDFTTIMNSSVFKKLYNIN